MDYEVINKLLENNFYEKVSYLPKLCKDMNVMQLQEGLQFIDASVRSDTFNVVCGNHLCKTIKEHQVCSIIDYYHAKNYPFAWWVGPHTQQIGLEEILIKSGLKHVETEIGMAANVTELMLDEKQSIPHITLIEVETKDDFKRYGNIMASVFDPFDQEAVAFYEKIAPCFVKNDYVKMFLGLINGEPAGISLTINDGHMGGVYDVVTHPRFQQKGIGTYMTKVALKQLIRDGCAVVGLQASNQGIGIYKKIGLKEYGTFKVYSFM